MKKLFMVLFSSVLAASLAVPVLAQDTGSQTATQTETTTTKTKAHKHHLKTKKTKKTKTTEQANPPAQPQQ